MVYKYFNTFFKELVCSISEEFLKKYQSEVPFRL